MLIASSALAAPAPLPHPVEAAGGDREIATAAVQRRPFRDEVSFRSVATYSSVTAPAAGRVQRILCAPGDRVHSRQALAELDGGVPIRAPSDGTLVSAAKRVGDRIDAGTVVFAVAKTAGSRSGTGFPRVMSLRSPAQSS